ncbi:hypothetical protein E2C01_002831 [Portunus trituberculatus]|uniref:Uncharacterized protein n=1 Tax=Portunus trituberculatus TaxID=210409 RepID=A0A5B7CLB9_PORTR|nr:hypothetical protein [Portunus trituberculatus]
MADKGRQVSVRGTCVASRAPGGRRNVPGGPGWLSVAEGVLQELPQVVGGSEVGQRLCPPPVMAKSRSAAAMNMMHTFHHPCLAQGK